MQTSARQALAELVIQLQTRPAFAPVPPAVMPPPAVAFVPDSVAPAPPDILAPAPPDNVAPAPPDIVAPAPPAVVATGAAAAFVPVEVPAPRTAEPGPVASRQTEQTEQPVAVQAPPPGLAARDVLPSRSESRGSLRRRRDAAR